MFRRRYFAPLRVLFLSNSREVSLSLALVLNVIGLLCWAVSVYGFSGMWFYATVGKEELRNPMTFSMDSFPAVAYPWFFAFGVAALAVIFRAHLRDMARPARNLLASLPGKAQPLRKALLGIGIYWALVGTVSSLAFPIGFLRESLEQGEATWADFGAFALECLAFHLLCMLCALAVAMLRGESQLLLLGAFLLHGVGALLLAVAEGGLSAWYGAGLSEGWLWLDGVTLGLLLPQLAFTGESPLPVTIGGFLLKCGLAIALAAFLAERRPLDSFTRVGALSPRHAWQASAPMKILFGLWVALSCALPLGCFLVDLLAPEEAVTQTAVYRGILIVGATIGVALLALHVARFVGLVRQLQRFGRLCLLAFFTGSAKAKPRTAHLSRDQNAMNVANAASGLPEDYHLDLPEFLFFTVSGLCAAGLLWGGSAMWWPFLLLAGWMLLNRLLSYARAVEDGERVMPQRYFATQKAPHWWRKGRSSTRRIHLIAEHLPISRWAPWKHRGWRVAALGGALLPLVVVGVTHPEATASLWNTTTDIINSTHEELFNLWALFVLLSLCVLPAALAHLVSGYIPRWQYKVMRLADRYGPLMLLFFILSSIACYLWGGILLVMGLFISILLIYFAVFSLAMLVALLGAFWGMERHQYDIAHRPAMGGQLTEEGTAKATSRETPPAP